MRGNAMREAHGWAAAAIREFAEQGTGQLGNSQTEDAAIRSSLLRLARTHERATRPGPAPSNPPRETPTMRLTDRALGASGLRHFLAKRREPGLEWQTWEQIAMELKDRTGELITRAGLTKWAIAYGIPIDTTPTSDVTAYRTILAESGITI